MLAEPRPKFVGKYDDRVARFVDCYWKRHYRAPTHREIAAACHASTSVIYLAVRRIAAARGDLVTTGTARGIIPYWVRQAIEGAAVSKEPR